MSALRVTPEAVVQSGGQVAEAWTPVVPAAEVVAAASDPVSVTVAHALGVRIAIIAAQSGAAHAQAQQAAEHLNANAADYATQEQAGASGLGCAAVPGAITPRVPAMPTIPAPPAFPSPQPATTPTTGKQIAELIHSGAGSAPLREAATRLRRHAEQLDDASAQLRSAATTLQAGWFSEAGEAAKGRILELADFYDQRARSAATVAAQADAQADNVSCARTAIPHPQEFADLEQRLAAAQRANVMPGSAGMYAPVIAQLQSQLAALNAKAAEGYAAYAADAETGLGSIQAVDWKTAPPDKVDDDTGGKKPDDDKKHGGSRSVGKGAKTHIEAHGEHPHRSTRDRSRLRHGRQRPW